MRLGWCEVQDACQCYAQRAKSWTRGAMPQIRHGLGNLSPQAVGEIGVVEDSASALLVLVLEPEVVVVHLYPLLQVLRQVQILHLHVQHVHPLLEILTRVVQP